jgi:hypothetical protein
MSEATNTAEATEPKAKKAPKAAKPKAEPKPKAEKVVETPAQMLARLKSATDTKARYARVTEILEVGKGGSPTKVRIKTDDEGPNGEAQYRDIKPQDLFQVRLSVAGQAAEAKKKRNKSASARRKTAGSASATKA